MTDEKKPTLAAKLCKLMKSCGYVQKDGKNTFHNYKYASAANVLEKVNEACVENGVASIPRFEIIRENGDLVTVQCTLTLIDADSTAEYTVISLGSGQDKTDKAVAKAQTMALKYAWMTALNISTGDDPEADESTDRNAATATQEAAKPGAGVDPNLASEKQLGMIRALAANANLDAAALKDLMTKLTGKTSSKLLTKADASKMIEYFQPAKAS